MIEPDDGEYVLAMRADATNEGALYQRDDKNGEGLARWFSLSDPDDVYVFRDLAKDYRTLIHMKATEWHDTRY